MLGFSSIDPALLAGGLVALAILFGGAGLLVFLADRRASQVRRRLDELTEVDEEDLESVIIRDMKLSSIPFFDRMLRGFNFAWKLETLLLQADASIRVGTFFLLMLFAAALGAFLTSSLSSLGVWAAPIGALAGFVPLIYVAGRRRKRMRRFEQQFPDALDLMVGALRSGMAFTGALQVVAEASPDPVSKEFRIVFEENRLGLDLREALSNLARRIDLTELRLFVTAVLLHRETGGDLAEVLDRTAFVIRDRFRILGDVRTITAHGRLSGFVLSTLPLVMAGILVMIAPEYMMVLLTDPLGPYMIAAALILQVVGFLLIRKIVTIEV